MLPSSWYGSWNGKPYYSCPFSGCRGMRMWYSERALSPMPGAIGPRPRLLRGNKVRSYSIEFRKSGLARKGSGKSHFCHIYIHSSLFTKALDEASNSWRSRTRRAFSPSYLRSSSTTSQYHIGFSAAHFHGFSGYGYDAILSQYSQLHSQSFLPAQDHLLRVLRL